MKKRILACIFAAQPSPPRVLRQWRRQQFFHQHGFRRIGRGKPAAEVTTVDYHYVNFGTIAETEPVDDVINEHLESIGSDVSR